MRFGKEPERREEGGEFIVQMGAIRNVDPLKMKTHHKLNKYRGEQEK